MSMKVCGCPTYIYQMVHRSALTERSRGRLFVLLHKLLHPKGYDEKPTLYNVKYGNQDNT